MTLRQDIKHDGTTSSTFADIKNAAGHKYQEAKDIAVHLAHDTSEKAAQVKDYIVQKSHVAKEKAIKAEESVVTYVKENPWKAVGISAAVGLILGKLLGHRK